MTRPPAVLVALVAWFLPLSAPAAGLDVTLGWAADPLAGGALAAPQADRILVPPPSLVRC